jgi:regulator of sirC expression with transglutaminase-like and TPR domain
MRWPAHTFFAALPVFILAFSAVPATAQTPPAPARIVREVLSRPETRVDYLEATISFDRLIDAHSDVAASRALVVRLTDAARQMAGPRPTDAYKLAAVRQAIYVAGAWNYGRPFSYDLDDPLGLHVQSKMLSTYVRTRKGNCVSMPTLFLIVADRIGLKVRLAAAPLHLFVRYTDAAGAEHNLEATSGGHEARLEWYRTNLPMSDRAIQSGIYMRTLSKRETIAEMATSVMDHLIEQRRYQEASDVADAILAVNPRDAYAMVKKGEATGRLIQTEFVEKYPEPALIPLALRARFAMLSAANAKTFRDAEALGWEAPAR